MPHHGRPSAPLFAALVLTVLAASGCATPAGQAGLDGSRDASAEAADRSTRVIVKNESEWTLRVYAFVSGARHYLGSLQGYSEEEFELSRAAGSSTADFRLAARATGPVSNYYSNAVIVEEGDTVRWTVLPSFTQTRATIRVS